MTLPDRILRQVENLSDLAVGQLVHDPQPDDLELDWAEGLADEPNHILEAQVRGQPDPVDQVRDRLVGQGAHAVNVPLARVPLAEFVLQLAPYLLIEPGAELFLRLRSFVIQALHETAQRVLEYVLGANSPPKS